MHDEGNQLLNDILDYCEGPKVHIHDMNQDIVSCLDEFQQNEFYDYLSIFSQENNIKYPIIKSNNVLLKPGHNTLLNRLKNIFRKKPQLIIDSISINQLLDIKKKKKMAL